MFLNPTKIISKITKRIALVGARETGSALIGVLGVMGVSGAVAVTSTTMSIHALGFTTSTRAGVQAEAAAQAGIDFAAANLGSSVCQSSYSNTTDPIFNVTVSYSTLAASPGDVDNSWVTGCPTNAQAARLRLVSTGYASTNGVAGNSADNARRVEAIYLYTPTPASSAINATGPALYSFSQNTSTINNLTLTQGGSAKPTIQYFAGSATCSTGSTIKGDLILGQGSASVTSGCTIDGDVFASNEIDIQSGEVTGDVRSHNENDDDENSSAGTHGSVVVAQSATVDGDVYSSHSVEVHGKVGGNVVAGPNKATSTFHSESSVGGSVVSSGAVTAASGSIKGTITSNKSDVKTPSTPTVAGWIDFKFKASDWVTSSGAPFTVLTMSSCGNTSMNSAFNTVQNSNMPIILDTRACGAVTDIRNRNLTLKNDTVIIGNGFNMSSNDIESSDANEKRLWIISPDDIDDDKPTCSAGSSVTVGSNVRVGTKVSALVYSPYTINNGGDTWNGQMYGASIATTSNFTLNFVPVGLPTVDLNTGLANTAPGTGVLGNRVSIRDIVIK